MIKKIHRAFQTFNTAAAGAIAVVLLVPLVVAALAILLPLAVVAFPFYVGDQFMAEQREPVGRFLFGPGKVDRKFEAMDRARSAA